MCPPEHFTVEYAINPWMDTSVPVDPDLAVKQWDRLRETLVGLGLNKIGRTADLPDTAATRGMINKVKHLVRVVDGK